MVRALLVTRVLHLAMQAFLGVSGYEEALAYDTAVARYREPLSASLLTILLVAATYHGVWGLRNVLLGVRAGPAWGRAGTGVTLGLGIVLPGRGRARGLGEVRRESTARGTVLLRVYRHTPCAVGDEPRMTTFRVPVAKGMTVLAALLWVKENVDPGLAFRYSCRMGICGSCGMLVNGRPELGCETQIAQLGTDVVG